MRPRRLLVLAVALLAVAGKAAEPITVAVVPMGTTHQYWQQLHRGALKAQTELRDAGVPVEIIWKGPLREDDREQQVQVVENFTARRVSGMVLAPLDTHALAQPVEQAVRAGIPVVIVDSPLASKAPVSTIATDNYAGGRMAGKRLAQVMNGRGNVILLRVQVGSASCEAREQGFLDELAEHYPGLKVISSNQHGGATRNTALAVSQNLLVRYGREVNGIFTPNESTLAGMLVALADAGLNHGRVKLVGFANSRLYSEALATGDLQGLVLQDPEQMGYLGVKSVCAVVKGESVSKWVDTGVMVATEENLHDPQIQNLLGP